MAIEWTSRPRARALSRVGIAEQNRYLLGRYLDFRRAADAVAAAWQAHPEVLGVAMIGSVASPPWKEVPRFAPYRRAGIALWHECKDVDLALMLADLSRLEDLRRQRAGRCARSMQRAAPASPRIRSTCSSSMPARATSGGYATSTLVRKADRSAWWRVAARRRSCAGTRTSLAQGGSRRGSGHTPPRPRGGRAPPGSRPSAAERRR